MLQPDPENGLKKDSLIRLSKLATIDKDIALGRIGRISSETMELINKNLVKLLKLDQ